MRASPHAAGRIMQTASTIESSRDFLQIPPHRASADAVLEWEIFRGKYPGDALIGVLFQPRDESVSSPASIADGVMTGTGLHPPDDEKIPSLIDSFLQNVHTKNPLLDAELLVKHGRRCAEHGVGWDALSCLVLLACALGTVAKPFGTSITQQPVLPRGTVDLAPSSASCSAHVYAKELQQAESCFALACRRLGSLKHTLLGAQCYFFAGGKSDSQMIEGIGICNTRSQSTSCTRCGRFFPGNTSSMRRFSISYTARPPTVSRKATRMFPRSL